MTNTRQQRTTIEAALSVRTIAIVGVSSNPARPSHSVARYLLQAGYEIIPVNPGEKEVLGLKCYPDLVSIPQNIDMVDVFRDSSAVVAIAAQAAIVKAKYLWLQLGVFSDEGVAIAEAAGIECVVDLCTKIEHQIRA